MSASHPYHDLELALYYRTISKYEFELYKNLYTTLYLLRLM